MRKAVCIQLFESSLKEVSAGRGYRNRENPAIEFTRKAKAGEYDALSDAEYAAMLGEVEEMAGIWLGEKNQTVLNLLRVSLENIEIPEDALHKLAETLAECYAASVAPFTAEEEFPDPENPKEDDDPLDWWFLDEEQNQKQKQKRNFPSQAAYADKKNSMDEILQSPKRIYDYLADRIHGQKEALKAASMLLYNHVHGRKRNVLFAGPTGCGKTEIWRVCKQIYPSIYIIDSTMITAEGWSGSFKVRDIFAGMSPEEAKRAIIVLDEFDKFCEPKIGSSGGNHSFMEQNELLKLIEGARMAFPEDRGKPAIEIDSSNISFAFCGSFERLTEMKTETETSASIGFCGEVGKAEARLVYESEISPDDLVKYAGMRQEIAGRINQIVQLAPMTADDYKVILYDRQISPLYQLEQQYGVKLHLDSKVRQQLVTEAEETHLGVRYLRSRIQQMLDEQMFQDCERTEYQLGA